MLLPVTPNRLLSSLALGHLELRQKNLRLQVFLKSDLLSASVDSVCPSPDIKKGHSWPVPPV